MRCRAHQTTTGLYLVLRRDLTGQFCLLVKVGQSLEEAEDLRFRENVREDAKVDTKLLEAFKVHL